MTFKKCPGQDVSRKKISEMVKEIACPFCDYAVEFFFDDTSRICPRCGMSVSKSDRQILGDLRCAVWCDAAEACLGKSLHSRLKKIKKEKR